MDPEYFNLVTEIYPQFCRRLGPIPKWKGLSFLWVEVCAGCLFKRPYRVKNGSEICMVPYENCHVVRVSDDGDSPLPLSDLNSGQLFSNVRRKGWRQCAYRAMLSGHSLPEGVLK